MLPLNYGNVYKTPDDYKPPDDLDFDDTEYPNLNSRDYARRPLNHTARMHEAWECLSISTPLEETNGNVAVCCNKLSGREWTGTLWGFEKPNVIENKSESMVPEKSCFKLQCPAIINCMTFVSPNIVSFVGFVICVLSLKSVKYIFSFYWPLIPATCKYGLHIPK